MQIVEFQLPPEVAADLFPDEGIRGTGNIQVLIEGLDVLSGLITVAGLRSALPVLARRIRTWRGSHPEVAEPAPALVVMAPGVRMEFPLPPNVSVQDIVEAVTKALPADADDARLMTNAPVADTSVRTYEMNLYRRYFDLVASGRKTIEVRVQYPTAAT